MAWLQPDPSSGNYHICFRFGGKRFQRSLRTKDKKKASRKLARLEESIELVEAGRLVVPENIDVPMFLLSEGKVNEKHTIQDSSLSLLFGKFFDSIPEGSLEPRTIAQMHSHRVHIEKFFGKSFQLSKLSFNELQSYVSKRSKGKGVRGRSTSSSTIKKELVTFRALWKWAIAAGRIAKTAFPSEGLRYPKSTELPIFQTFENVLGQTQHLNPESNEAKDLWSCVFLNTSQVEELLDHVEKNARHAFIYPMFVFAAHTGARRGEILRSLVSDVGEGLLAIRERKRKKRKNSVRHVPVSDRLRQVLDDWQKIRPASMFTICNVPGCCKHLPGKPITIDQSNDHFETTLKGSKFRHLRGWHVFRHSFCSNCAAAGIDQRVIDEWVGHTTEEMRRRYRHLFPNNQRDAMNLLFRT